eukprot:CAMPEP_0195055304 /NCGR_PEP_ID=MMETSP0448-20130528/4002_1 /TAXON_ID=66468 /ORGANISM="Heterocapsa triquestra, Strain CCMP 448" /LENGTH=37 /DNA_ID= /DNA_START= /DNA_END= /DNA_ORIENTATION=
MASHSEREGREVFEVRVRQGGSSSPMEAARELDFVFM